MANDPEAAWRAPPRLHFVTIGNHAGSASICVPKIVPTENLAVEHSQCHATLNCLGMLAMRTSMGSAGTVPYDGCSLSHVRHESRARSSVMNDDMQCGLLPVKPDRGNDKTDNES